MPDSWWLTYRLRKENIRTRCNEDGFLKFFLELFLTLKLYAIIIYFEEYKECGSSSGSVPSRSSIRRNTRRKVGYRITDAQRATRSVRAYLIPRDFLRASRTRRRHRGKCDHASSGVRDCIVNCSGFESVLATLAPYHFDPSPQTGLRVRVSELRSDRRVPESSLTAPQTIVTETDLSWNETL